MTLLAPMSTPGKLKFGTRCEMIVSFDFDNTLTITRFDELEERFLYKGPNEEVVNILKSFHALGVRIFIVTSRFEKFEQSESDVGPNIETFLSQHGLAHMVKNVIFTNGKPKAHKLHRIGARIHFDDDEKEASGFREGLVFIHVTNGFE